MPASDIKSVAQLMCVAAPRTVPNVQADATPTRSPSRGGNMRKIVHYASMTLAFGLATSQAVADGRQPPSAFDAFVKEVGIDISKASLVLQHETPRVADDALHALFCATHPDAPHASRVHKHEDQK